jgi:hypothetical protein
MAIAVNNTTKIATISGTSEASPQTIASVIDAIIAVDPTNASRTFNTGWIGGTWLITFATFTDFVTISAGFTLELRATAAFQMIGSFILAEGCTLIVARSTGLGFGNLANFQNTACKLVTKRLSNAINPKVVVDCQGGSQRSDFFGSLANFASPQHQIEGLDLIFRGSNFGFIKLYSASSAETKNVNCFPNGGGLNFFTNSAVESGCPTFTNMLIVSNSIVGETGNTPVYVRLKGSRHLSSGAFLTNNRASYIVLIDPVFDSGIPTTYGESASGNYQSGGDIRFTYNASVFDEVGSPIVNANIRFKRSDGFTTNLTTNSSGTIAEQELLYRQAPSVAATSRAAGTLATFTWEVKGRSYGHLQSTEIYSSSAITTPQVRSVTMITDPNISLTNAQALALTGIIFNFTAKKITMTGQLCSNLYHYYKAVISNPAQFDVSQFMVIAGGTLSISDGWSLDVDGGVLSGNSAINNILVSGTFTLLNSASNTIPVTDSTKTTYPPAVFTGFPTLANANGVMPESVFGIKNESTGVWTTFDASSGTVSVALSNLGTPGQTLTIVADAKGYYRTPEVTGVPLSFVGQNLGNLFEEITNSDGVALYGNGVQSEMDRIVYNATDATFDLDGGPISFKSALDKKEEITSSQSALTTMNTTIVRAMRFDQNAYAKTVQLPLPLKIRANATTTTAPILLDFNIVEVGNVNGDPYIHSARPEVQVRLSKIIEDPKALANLSLIPALL